MKTVLSVCVRRVILLALIACIPAANSAEELKPLVTRVAPGVFESGRASRKRLIPVTSVPALERSEGPSLLNLFNGLPALLLTVSEPPGVDLSRVVHEIFTAPWLKALGSRAFNGASEDSGRSSRRLMKP